MTIFHATAFMFAAIKRATENKLTLVVSVGELDAVDVQRHSEVHRPPRVRCYMQRVSTRTIKNVSAMTAVVHVLGVQGAISVGAVSADYVCRTIESDVHI